MSLVYAIERKKLSKKEKEKSSPEGVLPVSCINILRNIIPNSVLRNLLVHEFPDHF